MRRQPIPPEAMANNPDWRADWDRGLYALAMNARLPEATATRLRAALAAVTRDLALAELARLIDPHAMATRWALAGRIADALDGFEASVAWRAIQAGGKPRSTYEAACTAVLRHPGPRTQRRLFDALTDA